jgi:hypothetical protein
MKSEWVSAIVHGIAQAWTRPEQAYGFRAITQTPTQYYDEMGREYLQKRRMLRLQHLAGCIGLNTRVIIGFPTELTAVVAEARSKGAPVQLLACPPRGAHEAENLRFAQENGMLLGEIDFTGEHQPTVPGARHIDVRDLADVIGYALRLPPARLDQGLLGQQDYFSHETVAKAA